MRNRKEERRWGIILAKEFGVPPDDIDVETFLDCVSKSKLIGEELLIIPGNKKEEEVLCAPHAGAMINKIIGEEYPFNDWL